MRHVLVKSSEWDYDEEKKFVEVCNRQAVTYVDYHKRRTAYVIHTISEVGLFSIMDKRESLQGKEIKTGIFVSAHQKTFYNMTSRLMTCRHEAVLIAMETLPEDTV